LTIENDEYVYDGQWRNGKREGTGMEVCIKRGKYTGEWLADKKHGEGISVSPEGDIFTGKWELGAK